MAIWLVPTGTWTSKVGMPVSWQIAPCTSQAWSMFSAMMASDCDAREPSISACWARFIAARTSGGRFVEVSVMSEPGCRTTRAFGHYRAVTHEPFDAARERIVHGGCPRLAPRTVADRRALDRELMRIRSEGAAVEVEVDAPGVAGVAAPVLGADGEVTAALGVSVPRSEFTARRWELERVVRTAAARARGGGLTPGAHERAVHEPASPAAEASTSSDTLNVDGVLTEPCEQYGCDVNGPKFQGHLCAQSRGAQPRPR